MPPPKSTWEVVKQATAAGEQLTSGTLAIVQSHIAERVHLEAQPRPQRMACSNCAQFFISLK